MPALSVEVSTLAAEDVPEAIAVLSAGFGANTITESTKAGLRAAPGAWLIARRGGSAAGVVTVNDYGRAAYVAMLAVDPRHRQRGVGTSIMRELLERLEARGVGTVLLDATADAEPLYRSLGFAEIDRTCVFVRSAPPPRGARADSAPAALARALELDAQIYGCDRSAFLRRFTRDPHCLIEAVDDGYLMARGPVIGPFAAASDATAERLLDAALQRRPHLERAFVPALNHAAAKLMRARDFTCTRAIAHMAHGLPSPFRRERIFSQASLGHG